ncbi:chain length determinant protein [Acetobacteraceae bacterium AT-5844]|nr:chain length determinant protein [Acetobacteraceae bacterium AT-5844]
MSLSPRDILTTIFLRKKLIGLAFAVPAAIAVAAAVVMPVKWSAEGLLLVQVSRESVGATDITGTGPTVVSVEMPKLVQSEVDMILSDVVLRRAVSSVPPGTFFPVAERRLFGLLAAPPPSVPAMAQELRRALLVLSSNTSNLLRVSASLATPEQSVAALQAVLKAYMEHRQEIFSQADAELLTAETTRMADALHELDEQIAKLRAENRILDLAQDIQVAGSRIASVNGRIDALRERKAIVDSQLAAGRQQLAQYPSRVVAEQETTNLNPNDNTRNELSQLILERRRMAAQYQPGWPPLAELDARIAALRQNIATSNRTRFETVKEIRNPAVNQLSLHMASLEVEAASISEQMQALESQLQEAQNRASQLLNAEATLRDLGRRRDALEASYRQIAERGTGARIAEDAQRSRSPTVIVAQTPEAAARPRDIRPALVVAGFFGALVAAVAAAILLTLFRRSFADTQEAARGLSLPGLAAIPPDARLEGGETVPAVTDLAAMLLDARAGGERLSLIQFVATGPQDGRSALALAVSAEIARARHLRTLLVDLETDGRAFMTAMGSHPVHDAQDPDRLLAFNTVIPNLWVAYNARASVLGDPQAGIERLRALLDRLRRELDVVVVVAPAEAGSYAMRRLTAMVDANVLVLRADSTDKGIARAARNAVLATGGKLVGFVMSNERPVLPRFLAKLVS